MDFSDLSFEQLEEIAEYLCELDMCCAVESHRHHRRRHKPVALVIEAGIPEPKE